MIIADLIACWIEPSELKARPSLIVGQPGQTFSLDGVSFSENVVVVLSEERMRG